MDLTRPILYRGFDFNTIEDEPEDEQESGVKAGCITTDIDYGDVEIVGFTEKSALKDGNDAADVFLGRRRITLRGDIFGYSRGDLFDRVRAMRFAINPVLAFRDDPAKKGYLPLRYNEPTVEFASFSTGLLDLQIYARAITGVRTNFARDRTGGADEKEISAPFQVTFEAIDPRAYLQQRTEHYIEGSGGTLELENRGGHPVAVNAMLAAALLPTKDRTFSLVIGGDELRVGFPRGFGIGVILLDGEKRTVSFVQSSVEVTRMDLISVDSVWTELEKGTTEAVWTCLDEDNEDADLESNSVIWYREAFV